MAMINVWPGGIWHCAFNGSHLQNLASSGKGPCLQVKGPPGKMTECTSFKKSGRSLNGLPALSTPSHLLPPAALGKGGAGGGKGNAAKRGSTAHKGKGGQLHQQ